MAVKPPQRANVSDMIGGFMQALQNISAQFILRLRPTGNYSGSESPTVSNSSPIVTNPWGTEANLVNKRGGGSLNINLAAGQSINLLTGQLSDPDLNQKTANNLNDAIRVRNAGEAGFQQAGLTSARNSPSILSRIDEMYMGNQNSPVQTGSQITNVNLSNENEVQGSATILGAGAKKPVAKPPAARALS